jgi:hypothetical protein
VTTIEASAKDNSQALQKAWIKHDVPQCGYCQSGQIMSAGRAAGREPRTHRRRHRRRDGGNICRCGTYNQIAPPSRRCRRAAARPEEIMNTTQDIPPRLPEDQRPLQRLPRRRRLMVGFVLPAEPVRALAPAMLHTPNAWVRITPTTTRVTVVCGPRRDGAGRADRDADADRRGTGRRLEKVRVEQAPVGRSTATRSSACRLTGGSTSVRGQGYDKLRKAGAAGARDAGRGRGASSGSWTRPSRTENGQVMARAAGAPATASWPRRRRSSRCPRSRR